MKTHPEASTFKVYNDGETNVYTMANIYDIESAFTEYAKKNPNLQFGGFDVKYKRDSQNNLEFQFYKKENANSIPQDPQEFKIFNDVSSSFQISANRKEEIKKIKTIEALKPLYRENPDLDISQAIIEVGNDGKYVARVLTPEEIEMETHKLKESLQGKNSFHLKIKTETQQRIKTIVALKTLYREKPDLDISQAIIEIGTDGKFVARVLTNNEGQMETVTLENSLKEKNFLVNITSKTQTEIKAEIEAEFNADLNTISSFFATPEANTELSDQTSTPENADKIKKLLTRVLTTDANKSNSTNPFNDTLKAYFVQKAKAEMEKGNLSKIKEILEISDDNEEIGILLKDKIDNFFQKLEHKVDILELDVELQKSEDEINALKLESDHEEDINKISSFFATPDENTENIARITKLLTKALTTDANESESEKTFKEKLKAYFVQMAKDYVEKEAKSGEPSEMKEVTFEDLIKQEIQKAKNEELLLSKVRLYIKENYPQLPMTIDQTSSPSLDSKNDFKALLESKDDSIKTNYDCEKIGKFKIYKNKKNNDFFVVNESNVFVFDKNDILDDDLTAHIKKKNNEIKINLELIDSYFKSPDNETFKTQVSDLLKKEFEIMRYNPSFKSIYGNKFEEEQGKLKEEDANKTKALALYDDCKFDLMNQYFENTSSIFLSKRVSQLLKNNDDEYLNKFKELLNKIPENSDTHKNASSLLKKSQKEELIDTFFKGSSPEKITIIKQEISADPELMEYFRKKFHTCLKTIQSLTTSYRNPSTIKENKQEIFKKISSLSSFKNLAQEILTSAQGEITKKLFDDVFDSISSSATQAPEALVGGEKSSTTLIGSDEQEKNVHAIKVFLSKLKLVIDKEKSQGGGVRNIKDAFSKSFPSDDSDPSKNFKIEFFNSLVDTLNNDNFTKDKLFLNFQHEELRQQELFISFSQSFNEKTIGALTALGDSIKTDEDHKLSTITFRAKKGSYTESKNEEIVQSKNLVYSTIFSSLFLASKERLESSASANNSSAPAPTAGSPSAEASGMSPAQPR